MNRYPTFRVLRFFLCKKAIDLPPYLQNNSWKKEFNYKLWVTKGTRFAAAKRCSVIARNSQLTLTILSSYLIFAGISPYILKTFSQTVDPDVMALVTTGTSILLLVFGLLESSKNLGLKAHEYDECALKVSRLYNKLRQLKEFDLPPHDSRQSLIDLTNQYDDTLDGYQNHEAIDFDIFKSQKRKYHGLSRIDVIMIKFTYYKKVHLLYHFFIFSPIIISYFIILPLK